MYARAAPAAETAISGVTCLETARLDSDAGHNRRITAAALDLKQRGWAIVDDVLPRWVDLSRHSFELVRASHAIADCLIYITR